jgi:hypothetical protein
MHPQVTVTARCCTCTGAVRAQTQLVSNLKHPSVACQLKCILISAIGLPALIPPCRRCSRLLLRLLLPLLPRFLPPSRAAAAAAGGDADLLRLWLRLACLPRFLPPPAAGDADLLWLRLRLRPLRSAASSAAPSLPPLLCDRDLLRASALTAAAAARGDADRDRERERSFLTRSLLPLLPDGEADLDAESRFAGEADREREPDLPRLSPAAAAAGGEADREGERDGERPLPRECERLRELRRLGSLLRLRLRLRAPLPYFSSYLVLLQGTVERACRHGGGYDGTMF